MVIKMRKYMLTIIISLLAGFLLSKYMLRQYSKPILTVFSEAKTAYLIQQGVYSSYESMLKNTSHLSDYIYSNVDSMYYAYIAMTLDNDNVPKLQQYYRDKNIDTIVKTTTINNKDVINYISQYDAILKQTDDKDAIKGIIKQVLVKYKGE